MRYYVLLITIGMGGVTPLQQDAMSLQQTLFFAYIFGAEIASSRNKFATKIDVRLDIRLTSLKHVKKHDVAYFLHLAVRGPPLIRNCQTLERMAS
jgi:hypothetical protein